MKISAKKSLGQNFLVNQGVVRRIIDTLSLQKTDAVLEIGPGTGVLTQELARKVKRVVAVEKDRRLISELKHSLPENVEIVEEDILKLKIRNLKLNNFDYKVVGNIPYYLTSHLIRTILEEWPQPQLVVLMVQKEVAQRMLAQPPQMNLLALSVQYYTKPELVMYVKRGSFRPAPKVDSAVIKLIPQKDVSVASLKLFKFIHAGFTHKRKKLSSNLAEVFHLERTKIETVLNSLNLRPSTRAEELGPGEWQLLLEGCRL